MMALQERVFKINKVIWTTKPRVTHRPPTAFSEKNVEKVEFFFSNNSYKKGEKIKAKVIKKVESYGKKKVKTTKNVFVNSIFNSSVSKLAKRQWWQ